MTARSIYQALLEIKGKQVQPVTRALVRFLCSGRLRSLRTACICYLCSLTKKEQMLFPSFPLTSPHPS